MHTPLPIDLQPERVISLVPSMTESMFDLGFGKWMVGCTDYCIYPQGDVDRLKKIGGPKNIDIKSVLDLKPDFVIANQEENRIEDFQVLKDYGIMIWETFPISVRDSMDDLWELAGLFHSEHAGRIIRSLEDSLDWLNASSEEIEKVSYFCPVWKQFNVAGKVQWMVFNKNTYMDDLLGKLGGKNIFANHQLENVNDEKKIRYPMIGEADLCALQPDVIILPDEPYSFDISDEQDLTQLFVDSKVGNIPKMIRVDGSLIMWHGTRLARSLNELQGVFQIN